MGCFKLLLFISLIYLARSEIDFEGDSPEVEVEGGRLRGSIELSRDGNEYFSFKGVPYGHIPERFESSVKAPDWEGIKNATEFGPKCVQLIGEALQGSEDCLSINIFVPKNLKRPKSGVPVLFYIHGGAFQIGSSAPYGPKYFMDTNTILVSVNYRVGPYGFFNTKDGQYGNEGLKDIVLALKWVQSNINSFGGNPGKVTIFGESSGAVSAHLLVLSPMTKGLFRNGILQSGTALAPWAFQESGEYSDDLAEHLNCPPEDEEDGSEALMDCLKDKEPLQVLLATRKIFKWLPGRDVIFTPSVEKKGRRGQPLFLHKSPQEILESGDFEKVDLINGICQDEGVLLHAAYVIRMKGKLQELNEDWTKVAPIAFAYSKLFPEEKLDEVSSKIRDFYFGEKEIGLTSATKLVSLYSDSLFILSARDTSRLHGQDSNVFPYVLNYKGEAGIMRKMQYIDFSEAVTHSDDLPHLFNMDMFPQEIFSEESIEFSKNMVRAWTTFADKGYPMSWGTQHRLWKPVDDRASQGQIPMTWYILSGLEPAPLLGPFRSRLEFWDGLLAEYSGIRTKDEL